MTDRKPRSIRATDDQWNRIKARAKAEGVTVSAFLLEPALRARRPRAIDASEAEWALVEIRAEEADMSVSEFLLARALEPAGGAERVVAVPVELLRRLALDIGAVAIAEAWRYEAEGKDKAWEAIVREARSMIDNVPDPS